MPRLTHFQRYLALLALLVLAMPAGTLRAQPITKVFINGMATPVYFNDGDTFRVLAGPMQGSSARLAGFNTLESFGPVHRWGDWNSRELYYIAKLATLNARRGVWHCTGDANKRDGYGRMLLDCPDLAVNQIRKGYAHAMSVTSDEGREDYLVAQRQAMIDRVGIWAKGTPNYVITSTHSFAENFDHNQSAYNRVVSAKDGHSLKWTHKVVYDECAEVCYAEVEISDAGRAATVAALRADPSLAAFISSYDNATLEKVVLTYLQGGFVEYALESKHVPLFEASMAKWRMGQAPEGVKLSIQSCMTYTDFTRRFGAAKAVCLKLK